jgi:hypothetical protein
MAAAIRLNEQHSCSFDHLVGARQQRSGDFEAERLGGRKIDDEIKLGRLLDRDVGRLRSAQDLVDIVAWGVMPMQWRDVTTL